MKASPFAARTLSRNFVQKAWLYFLLWPRSAATSSLQPSTLKGADTHLAPVARM